jgi:hypothetical protein
MTVFEPVSPVRFAGGAIPGWYLIVALLVLAVTAWLLDLGRKRWRAIAKVADLRIRAAEDSAAYHRARADRAEERLAAIHRRQTTSSRDFLRDLLSEEQRRLWTPTGQSRGHGPTWVPPPPPPPSETETETRARLFGSVKSCGKCVTSHPATGAEFPPPLPGGTFVEDGGRRWESCPCGVGWRPTR